MLAYIFIVVVQIVFNTQIIFGLNTSDGAFGLRKIFGTTLVLVPFVVDQVLFHKQNSNFLNSALEEWYVVSYVQLIHNKDIIRKGIAKINQSRISLSKENMLEIISNLLRQSSFRYVSNGSLTNEYFDLAYSTLNEGFIYIIITNFGSAASRLISIFKNKSFNHVLLSFDKKLYTIFSYNGGKKISPLGLNTKIMNGFCKNADSSIMVYRLKATSVEKKKIIDKVHEINEQGNAYNLLELNSKNLFKLNKMPCSQFVYKILALANLIYFQKDIANIRPTDFVELDYYRKLEFAYEIKFCKKSSDLEYKT
ncbi:hypothetical protein [Clostridium sp. E02]|uniref:hypothetical protein n=1 Tax=Clostridium sp. E02 TaxID=2487134 RepID=UPI000F51BBA2|nr:hypothetical protein [Clostridium sp. E02]